MSAPLSLGVAGLGTVGAALVPVSRRRQAISARCGRHVEVVAVCARSRNKNRGVDLSRMKWFDDPVELAALARHRRLRRADRRRRRSGQGSGRSRAQGRQACGHRQQGAARPAWRGAGRARGKEGPALNFEAAAAAGIPVVKSMREALAGAQFTRVFGILNGTCNYILTRMEQEGLAFDGMSGRGAAAWLCGSRSDFRHRRLRHRAEARDPGEPRLRHQRRRREIYVEGISSLPADIQAAHELGYRIKLLGVAVRTETGIEQRVHPTMVPMDPPSPR